MCGGFEYRLIYWCYYDMYWLVFVFLYDLDVVDWNGKYYYVVKCIGYNI